METLDQEFIEQSNVNLSTDSRKTHLERIISIIPLPYWWGWLIFGGMLFLIQLLILIYFERTLLHIELSFILSVVIAQEGIVITWAHNKLKLFKNTLKAVIALPDAEIIKWHEKWIAKTFSNWKMAVTGFFIYGLAHALSVNYLDIKFDSTFSYISFEAIRFIADYTLGAGLYVMLMTAFMVHGIGELPLKIIVLQRSKIQDVGLLYSKFTICASSVYGMWIIFYMLSPTKFSTLAIVLWFASFAVLLLAYFILPQYSLHKIIVKTKKEKISVFTSSLRDTMDEVLENPTKENILHLNNMLDIQRQLDKMSEWPFGSYELIHIACIVIIPLVVLTLEVIFNVIR